MQNVMPIMLIRPTVPSISPRSVIIRYFMLPRAIARPSRTRKIAPKVE